jgi:hypothetical protein
MVCAMDGHMAIDAGAIKNPVVQRAVHGLIGIRAAAGRQFAGMSHVGVAALAQEGNLGFQ